MKFLKILLSFLITALFLSPPKTSVPYSEYVALISQSGTSAPTAVVLENTLNVPITYAYGGVGQYTLRGPSGFVFDDQKTAVWTGDAIYLEAEVNHNQDRMIYLYTSSDSLLYLQTIYVRVYK